MKLILWCLTVVFAIYLAEARSVVAFDGAVSATDKQDDLLSKIVDLLSKSKLARELLEKEGKPLLAEGIKKIEELLAKLEDKVKAINPKNELGKLALEGLEALIEKAEEELDKELKKIQEGSYYGLEDKAELIIKLAELLSKSKFAQELLEKAGKPLLAAGIKKVEELLNDLDEKLKKADPNTEIGKLAIEGLEKLIEKAEEELEKELKKIEETDSTILDGGKQEDLLTKVVNLLTKSQIARELLEAAGKPLYAKAIQKVEELLQSLENKVKNANPKTALGRLALKGLEFLVEKAEKALEDELKKVEGNTGDYYGLEDKADLLIKLAELLSKSKLARELLEKEGKPLLAEGIKKIEDLLKSLDEKLQKADPKTEVGKLAILGLEKLIEKAEEELEKELKKIEESDATVFDISAGDEQENLLTKLVNLLTKSQAARELLEKLGKPLLAEGIKKIEDLLHSLEDKVKNANPKNVLGKLALKGLEFLIEKAEKALDDELQKITGQLYLLSVPESDLKDELIKIAQKLKTDVEGVIAFLKSEGKSIEASELQMLEAVVSGLEKQLEQIEPKTELGQLLLTSVEDLLQKAEEKLQDFLNKLDAHP